MSMRSSTSSEMLVTAQSNGHDNRMLGALDLIDTTPAEANSTNNLPGTLNYTANDGQRHGSMRSSARISERHPRASRNVRSRTVLTPLSTLAPLPMPLPPRLSRAQASSKHTLASSTSPTGTPVKLAACMGAVGCWWCPSPLMHVLRSDHGHEHDLGLELDHGLGLVREHDHSPRSMAAPQPGMSPHHDADVDPERLSAPITRVHPDSFTGSIRHALIIGYFFSILYPELGPSSVQESPQARRWTVLKAVRALYTVSIMVGLSVLAALSLYREMTADSLWDSSVDMMFFGSAMAASVFFLDVGRQWRRLTQAFESVETKMRDFGYPQHLRRKMKRVTALVLLGAAVEHIFSVWSAVDFTWPCYEEAGPGGLLKGYSLLKFPMTFSVLTYEHWKAVVVLVFNFVGTFFWNFNHLFVMLISMPLKYRFKQVNERLEAVTGKVMTDDFWRRARETYNELSVLSRLVDDAIGKLVLLSFASNMYFICRQLLHSFRTLRTGFWYTLYFEYSFSYVLLRTVLVSLFAASVNDESRRPLAVLFSVPAEGFTHEVERFMSQVVRDHVALTGCRFFSVTRGLILTVAGTIISYEIVLMQLHPMVVGTTHKTDHMEHCGL